GFRLCHHCKQLARCLGVALNGLGVERQQHCLLTADVAQFAIFADRDTLFEETCEIGLKVARPFWTAFRVARLTGFKLGALRRTAVAAWRIIIRVHWLALLSVEARAALSS